jgi:predicted 2-oxoglutarate/Fe(II)-dependent dioxygenase YbiX
MIWLHEDGQEVAPGIVVLDNALSPYDCKTLISAAMENLDDWQDGAMVDPNTGGGIVDDRHRKVRTKDLTVNFQTDPIYYEVSRKMFHYAVEYSDKYHTHFNEMEVLSMLHYKPGDFYGKHADAGAGGLMQRSFSAVLYLNDVDEGGETRFEYLDVSVSPKEGRLVMFPSSFLYAHEALPPVDGDKLAVVTWFRVI